MSIVPRKSFSKEYTGLTTIEAEIEAAGDPGRCECGAIAVKLGVCAACYLDDLKAEIAERSEPVPGSDCWIWTGTLNGHGYGVIQGMAAHRVSWSLANGRAVSDKMFICHSCDVPACVNPAHLFEGTPRENSVDSMRKGRKIKTATPDKIRRVYSLHKTGMFTAADIGKIVGLTSGTVSRILRGEQYDFGLRSECA